MTEQSYARVARLIYLARYRAEKPKAALAQAHRLAARVVRGGAVGDAAVREAASRLIKMGSLSTLRYRVPGTGPYLAPAEPDADQRAVLDRLGAVEYELRIAVLRHLIDGTDPDDLGADSTERIRSATAKVCRDLDVDEVRVLLTGAELDPMIVAVPARRAFARRRRRVRVGAAIAGLVLAATATGLWRFDLRTEPLGWYADDPRIQTTVGRYDFDIDAWNARGELLGDAALLRRAASAWRERSSLKLPASIGPMIVFAGRVHGVAAVLMTNKITGSNPWSSDSVAVYIEGAQVRDQLYTTKDHRLYVNPAHEGMQAGGIRLLDAKSFRVDEILLPPGARDVETGPLDTPAVGWQPARVDARGVLEVPMPTVEPEQSVNHPDWSPSAGIRYSEPSQNILLRPSVTIQETFFDSAPLLPNIEPHDFYAGTAARPLSDADWCAVRKQAEITDHLHVSYVWQSLSDLASGSLPDGGGTGYLMIRNAQGQANVQFEDATLMAFPDKSCASATFQPGLNLLSFGFSGAVEQDPAFSSSPPSQGDPRTAAVFWTSPAKRTYLIVAASDKVSRLRVTGPVPAQADGRWLVVPMPATYDGTPQAEQASVEAFDSGGHRCGDPVPGTKNDRYC